MCLIPLQTKTNTIFVVFRLIRNENQFYIRRNNDKIQCCSITSASYKCLFLEQCRLQGEFIKASRHLQITIINYTQDRVLIWMKNINSGLKMLQCVKSCVNRIRTVTIGPLSPHHLLTLPITETVTWRLVVSALLTPMELYQAPNIVKMVSRNNNQFSKVSWKFSNTRWMLHIHQTWYNWNGWFLSRRKIGILWKVWFNPRWKKCLQTN